MSQEKLYDLTNLRAISRGNEDFVKRMVSVFREQTPELFNEMTLAWQQGNLARMSALAHKMKPSIDNLHITVLQPLIRQIESDAQNQIEVEVLLEKIALLDSYLEKVILQMNEEFPD